MTTRTFPVPESVRRAPYDFPDPPPPDDMNDYVFLSDPGYPPALRLHWGSPRNDVVVVAGAYVSRQLPESQAGLFYPDLLIAFDVDREAVLARKGFVIAEQGKPPDFVLELGSASTGLRDVREKRSGYAGLGVSEYWRFDPSGGLWHRRPPAPGAALAGDILVNGQYEPLPIQRTDDGVFWGYSPALNLELHWYQGRLLWYDPAEQLYIPTYDDERGSRLEERSLRLEETTRREAAEAQIDVIQGQLGISRAQRDTAEAEREDERAQREATEAELGATRTELDVERAQREAAESERDAERAQREAAEARARELEAQLRRLQNPNPP